MNTSYPAVAERSKANAAKLRETLETARTGRKDAQRAVDDMVRALDKFSECPGVSRDYLHDCLTGLLDQTSNVIAKLEKDLDEAGGWYPLGIDLAEARTLLVKVSA